MPVDRALEAAFDAILTDRPIAYRPALARAAGSVTAGILLAQAIYWSPRGGDADGWFYKTQQEWEAETALTRSEWINARKQLRGTGLLHERLRGVPATLHYRVDLERLIDVLGGAAPDRRMLRSRSQAPGEPDRSNPANLPFHAETTPEKDDPLAVVWATALADLAEQTPPGNYARWLSRVTLAAAANGTAVVACPDRVTAEQLRRRYDALIRQAVSDALGRPVSVEYRADGDR